MRYFELTDDVNAPGRWHLTNPTDRKGRELDDPWQFTDGRPLQISERMVFPIKYAGRALDFTMAGLNIPVVHVKVASILAELAPNDVQLIPVDIEGQPDQYLVLVATKLIRCIDDARCAKVQFWKPEDGRPEKTGKYKAVYRMKIDTSKVGDTRVF